VSVARGSMAGNENGLLRIAIAAGHPRVPLGRIGFIG
jgi:hypothetical protein